jgi:hypothetical protein
MENRNKNSRAVTMANNWKKKEVDKILCLRDEMLSKKIDNKLIEEFVNEQYEIINQKYEKKISKNNMNNNKKELINAMKTKRKKAINFLLLNKQFLEDKGMSPEYIQKYVEQQYNEINELYSLDNIKIHNDIDIEQVEFID